MKDVYGQAKNSRSTRKKPKTKLTKNHKSLDPNKGMNDERLAII
jgi:hypothetical protein